jgi:hypothetical protein
MPTPIALAATWDTTQASTYGGILGSEAFLTGHNVLLGQGAIVSFQGGDVPVDDLTAPDLPSSPVAQQVDLLLCCIRCFGCSCAHQLFFGSLAPRSGRCRSLMHTFNGRCIVLPTVSWGFAPDVRGLEGNLLHVSHGTVLNPRSLADSKRLSFAPNRY